VLDAFCGQQENGGSPVSHPALDTKVSQIIFCEHSVIYAASFLLNSIYCFAWLLSVVVYAITPDNKE